MSAKALHTFTAHGRQRRFRRRRKRGGDGFNYTEMMIALDPATADRIGLTARSKISPGSPGAPTPATTLWGGA